MRAREDLRIAIVGAGVSGLSFAWYLKQMGFSSVTFFEATGEVGGQSHTIDIDGVPVEMGTCYLADGYVIAREIAHAAGCPPARLPPPTFLDTNGRVVSPAMPTMGQAARYVWRWLGWYLGGQMWTPADPENALGFVEWLDRKGLGDLASSIIFADGCTAQLYGPLADITAYNGLIWVRPSLLLTGRREDTAHIPAGFQNMWRGLLRHLAYEVRADSRVVEVVAAGAPDAPGDAVTIVLANGAREQFDHAIVACPLDDAPGQGGEAVRHPLSGLLRASPPFDATLVYSAIWRGTNWPAAAPSRCYLPAASSGERGRLLTIRQFGRVGEDWVGQLCSYALDNAAPIDHDALLVNRDRVVADMTAIVGLRDIRIVHDRLWRYSIRYSAAQLRDGLPGRIAERQGAGGVWYTGGALSHWDVDTIANFNQALAWRFAIGAGVPLATRLRIVRLRDLVRSL